MTTVPGECLICARYIQKKTTVNYGTDFVELNLKSSLTVFLSGTVVMARSGDRMKVRLRDSGSLAP
jgi:hypothetical protein